MSTPIVGIGNQFEFATISSPTTFTTLNGVTAITFSGDKIATEKTTTMATAPVETYISSLQEPGSVDVKCFFYPAESSQVALATIMGAGLAVQMKATYGSGNSSTFSGIVESMTRAFPMDKNATLDIKIKISGSVTLA